MKAIIQKNEKKHFLLKVESFQIWGLKDIQNTLILNKYIYLNICLLIKSGCDLVFKHIVLAQQNYRF